MTLTVDVQHASTSPGLPDTERIERWARAAAAAAGGGDAEVSVRLVDDGEGAALNATFRGRDGPTNVLSFPFDAPQATDPPLLGDVVICAPVVVREAAQQGKAVEAHYAHMVVHGVLHLLGHAHEHDADAERMEALERRVLAALGYPDPYRSRLSVPAEDVS
jgi:probable rRNA maturation factor